MNDSSNSPDQPTSFRRRDAQRIASAVHAHETGRKPRSASSLPRAAGGGGGGGGVARGEFGGSWYKGQTKVVTVSGETARCNNFIVDILYSNSNRTCFMASYQAGGNENDPPEYTLLIPECIR